MFESDIELARRGGQAHESPSPATNFRPIPRPHSWTRFAWAVGVQRVEQHPRLADPRSFFQSSLIASRDLPKGAI